MKLKTFAMVYGPILLSLALVVVFVPHWVEDFNALQWLFVASVMGVFGAVCVMTLESSD